MTVSGSFLLGLVQGLTEFLPVSSSGHLVLASRVLDLTMSGVAFEVWLHVATLTAVGAALWRDILFLVRGNLPGAPREEARRARVFVLALAAGTLPAVVVGLLAKDAIEAAFTSVRLVGADLLLTAVILFATRFLPPGTREADVKRGFLVGVAQALAILPGVSRSGTTLAAATALGLRTGEALRFSFLLAVPVILGGVVLEAGELREMGGEGVLPMAVGFITAAASGYLAIRVVWRVMERRKLALFAPYCAAVGVVAMIVGGTVVR